MANNSAGLAELRVQGEELYISHLLTGNGDDIQAAVGCARKVFELMPPTDPSMPIIQYNLARSLFRKFLETRQIEDVKMAIEKFRDASQATSERLTDDMRKKCLCYLTLSCHVRDGTLEEFLKLNDPDVYGPSGPPLQIKTLVHKFDEDEVFCYLQRTLLRKGGYPSTSLKDLDSAIQLTRQALNFFTTDRALILGSLDQALNALNQAFNQALKIDSRMQARRFLSPDPINTSMLLFHLGNLLLMRASLQCPLQRKLEDIDEAANKLCCALRMGLPFPYAGHCLVYASSAFVERYEALTPPLRRHEDLHKAFHYAMQAMEMLNQLEHAEPGSAIILDPIVVSFLWRCLENMARVRRHRYEATGEVIDLNAAIDASSRAIDIADTNDFHKDLPRLLSNFAANLKLRVQLEQTGDGEDMKLANKVLQRAADILSPNYPRRVRCPGLFRPLPVRSSLPSSSLNLELPYVPSVCSSLNLQNSPVSDEYCKFFVCTSTFGVSSAPAV